MYQDYAWKGGDGKRYHTATAKNTFYKGLLCIPAFKIPGLNSANVQ